MSIDFHKLNILIKNQFIKNSYLSFLPLLAFYLLLIWHRPRYIMDGDEPRYYGYAINLIHGFYSSPPPDINLWSGPGYSIILIPFVALHLPLFWIKVLNTLLMYCSVVFLHKSLKLIVNIRLTLILSLFWGFYYYAFKELTMVLTEPLTSFLISAFLYSIVKYWSSKQKGLLILAGVLLGYIALTKIIWGYVILITLSVGLIMLLFKANRYKYKLIVAISTIALLINLPYLVYTYNLTGKVFYWGNSGGMSLYWMSTPYPDEYGDWKPTGLINGNSPEPYGTAKGDSILQANHKIEIQYILKHTGVAQDNEFKKAALKNIKAHPVNLLKIV